MRFAVRRFRVRVRVRFRLRIRVLPKRLRGGIDISPGLGLVTSDKIVL